MLSTGGRTGSRNSDPKQRIGISLGCGGLGILISIVCETGLDLKSSGCNDRDATLPNR